MRSGAGAHLKIALGFSEAWHMWVIITHAKKAKISSKISD